MLPPSHPLVEAATKPLADNAESRLAANALLEENFDEDHPAIGEALERLEKVDAKRFPRLWRVCLHVCAATAFLLLTFPALQVQSVLQNLNSVTSISYNEETKLIVPADLTPNQRLLIGDPTLPQIRQSELLHLSAPKRPDFFTEYTGKYANEHDRLPDKYLEKSARIDPKNSFHLYNAAARGGGDSVEKVKSKTKGAPRYVGNKRLRDMPDEVAWKLNDEEKFNEAMDLVAKAATLPHYDNYETSLSAERLPLFNQDRMIPRIWTLAYFAGQSTQTISILKVANLISAKAYFLSLEGDEDGFLSLYADSEAFLSHLSHAPDSHLVTELVYAVSAAGTANAFDFGAERLGLSELAEKMFLRKKAFIDDANMRTLREDPMSDHIERKGSILTRLTAPAIAKQVANPPLFDPETLTPGRLAEYEFYSAVLLPVVASILGLAALVAFISGALLPRPAKLLSKRFGLLLRPADWVWVAGAVLAPIALIIIITRYTPLGGINFSISHNQMLFPAAHYLLLIFVLLTVTPATIRWRLEKRLGAFGIRSGSRPVFLIFFAVGGLCLLFAHPIIDHFSIGSGSRAMLPLALITGLWGAAIVFGLGSIYFVKKERVIVKVAALGALPTALSFAIILLVALVPVLRESAERWVARDTFTRVVPTGLSFYEAEIAAQKRKETKAILGIE